ncbi:MAG TPA: NfeD family protein [Solirubrobacteraceae bacterium]|nr:NfeD family protein [Solirubrobacteraceae bacterium]
MSTFGIVLLLLGAALAVAEAHVPSHGALGSSAAVAAAGGIALVVGGAGFGLAAALAAGLVAGLVAAIYVSVVLRKAFAASRRRVRSGPEGLIGRVGEVRAAPAPLGQVFLDGALWRARVWAGDEQHGLRRGDPIVVERVDGLTLTVRRAEEWEVAP